MAIQTDPEHLLEAMQKWLEDILEAQSQFKTKLWWRGQSLCRFGLEASVYRYQRDETYEESVISYFMSKAPARYPNCPTSNSELDWLFLMQHYGLPTRLLDWTESPLIALFFALWEENLCMEPGAVWGLSPGKLNEIQTGEAPGLISPSKSSFSLAKDIAKDAFEGIQHEDDGQILAVQPKHFDIKMLVQQSVCTIHGMRTHLEEMKNSDEFLRKIPISPEQKHCLRVLLEKFGIRQSTLFPDLENLAKELASYEYIKA